MNCTKYIDVTGEIERFLRALAAEREFREHSPHAAMCHSVIGRDKKWNAGRHGNACSLACEF